MIEILIGLAIIFSISFFIEENYLLAFYFQISIVILLLFKILYP